MGTTTFMRCPHTRDLAEVDVVVSGIPLDLTTSYRPGARFGPAAIRAASAPLAILTPYPWGFDPFAVLRVVDWGDYPVDQSWPGRIFEGIHTHARAILDAGCTMLTLGGDHFLTYPLLAAHAAVHGGPLALVHFDAHPDTWEDDPGALHHGTMLWQAVRERLVDPRCSVQVGIRTHVEDPLGFTVLDAPWVLERHASDVVAEIRRVVGTHPAYLSFDIDVLDPAFAPGTGSPVAGGLSSAQTLAILRGLTHIPLVGLDVVEVAPPYDTAGITAVAAAQVVCDLLCVLAARRRGG